MNRSQLITSARTLMAESDPNASYVTNDELILWLNDGIDDMCIKGEIYLRTLSIDVTNNISSYHLPWTFINDRHLLNHLKRPIEKVSDKDIGRLTIRSGYPLYFYLHTTPLTIPSWQASTSYSTWQGTPSSTYVIPTTPNGFMYECILSGQSGTTEPTWPTTRGSTVTDNTTRWICRPLVSSLKTLTLVDTPTTSGDGVGTYTLLYASRDNGLPTDTSSPTFDEDKHRYLIPYLCYRWSLKSQNLQLATLFYQEYAAGVGIPLGQPPTGETND